MPVPEVGALVQEIHLVELVRLVELAHLMELILTAEVAVVGALSASGSGRYTGRSSFQLESYPHGQENLN